MKHRNHQDVEVYYTSNYYKYSLIGSFVDILHTNIIERKTVIKKLVSQHHGKIVARIVLYNLIQK